MKSTTLFILALNFLIVPFVKSAPCASNCLQVCSDNLAEALSDCRQGNRGKSCRRRANSRASDCRDFCGYLTTTTTPVQTTAAETTSVPETTPVETPSPTPLTCFQICETVYESYTNICAGLEDPQPCYEVREEYNAVCTRDCSAFVPSTTPEQTSTTSSSTSEETSAQSTETTSEVLTEISPSNTSAKTTAQSTASTSPSPLVEPLTLCLGQCNSNYELSSIICESTEDPVPCYAQRDLYDETCQTNCNLLYPVSETTTTSAAGETSTSSSSASEESSSSVVTSTSAAESTPTATCEEGCLDAYNVSTSSCADPECVQAAQEFLFACLQSCGEDTGKMCTESSLVATTETYLTGSFTILPVSTTTVTA